MIAFRFSKANAWIQILVVILGLYSAVMIIAGLVSFFTHL